MATSWNLGLTHNYSISKNFRLSNSLKFFRLQWINTEYNRINSLEGIVDDAPNEGRYLLYENFIELPTLLSYNLEYRRISISISIGHRLLYYINTHSKDYTDGFSAEIEKVAHSENVNSLNTYATMESAFNYHINSNLSVYFSPMHNYQFNSFLKNPASRRNYNFSRLGIKYVL